ncbi:MAG: arsenic transporter [Ferruginibacter sp.]
MSSNILIWVIAVVSITGVIIRPFKIPEAIWAVGGAVLLVITRLLLPAEAWKGINSGTDVYLFLTGMMLLAEIAREEKLFDWLAAHATKRASGSPKKLFILIYSVGIIVTTFLSNDATAVVLTPAVAAAMKAAKIEKPLPYLLICAFIANAASFVLPISNPANLVIYGSHMPPLLEWLPRYILPSAASIIITFLLLKWTQRKELKGFIETSIETPLLSEGGKTAALGVLATAVLLLIASGLDWQLGLPTAIAGLTTSLIVLLRAKKNPLIIVKGVSWAVLPLVAGLFVIVEALNKTGLVHTLSRLLQSSADRSIVSTAWTSGLLAAFGSNLTNNLPAGLVAGNVVQASNTPEIIRSSILIGIDLGPNLSITGSLATILWLVALRREGQDVTAWSFLKLGLLIMTVTLIGVLACLWI